MKPTSLQRYKALYLEAVSFVDRLLETNRRLDTVIKEQQVLINELSAHNARVHYDFMKLSEINSETSANLHKITEGKVLDFIIETARRALPKGAKPS